MAVSIAGLRRNIKNVAHNYTDAQVKVREATSNDPWGPSSTQMSEIADLTYNMVAFSEIMQMIWKRLNDHGKNWRHVYKALVLLEYLIKTGSEKVAQQCKENIFAIQTLKDFQFVEDNKDQGLNVREKAKALVTLLKDDERLKNERTRALKAKERFAQSTQGYPSHHEGSPMGSPGEDYNSRLKPDIELARPQTHGEEELQLQLALAMSREEAEAEDSKKKSDDMRLQMAIAKSKEDDAKDEKKTSGSALNDLVDLNFGAVVSPNPPQRTAASLDPWSPLGEPAAGQPGNSGQSADPWGGMGPIISTSTIPDPWGGIGGVGVPPSRGSPLVFGSSSPPSTGAKPAPADPWGSSPAAAAAPVNTSNGNNDPWGSATHTETSPAKPDPFSPGNNGNSDPNDVMAAFGAGSNGASQAVTASPAANPWDLGGLDPVPLMPGSGLSQIQNQGAKSKPSAVENMLGEHSNLVNLDSLLQPKRGVQGPGSAGTGAKNPFSEQPNPFQAAAAPKPSMNQLRGGNQPQQAQQGGWPNQGTQNNADINPFF